jgi:hypothetical protein
MTMPALANIRGEGASPRSEQCGWPSAGAPLKHNHHNSNQRRCSLAIDDKTGPDPSDWAPWTERPYCADTEYCVFTNSAFRGNHGVSIITTPEIAASSPDLLAKLTSSHTFARLHRGGEDEEDEEEEEEEEPHTVRDIPGKGKGLFATRRIPRGEVLMEDYPSVLADVEFPGRVRREQGRLLLERAIGQLGQADEVLALARSSTAGAAVQEDVMRTNTFGLTIGERSRMALFPRISVGWVVFIRCFCWFFSRPLRPLWVKRECAVVCTQHADNVSKEDESRV